MRIVNLHTFKGGRRRLIHLGGVYCGRPSPLGNPFEIGIHGTREEVIELFRRWLWEKIQQDDGAVMAALSQLREDSILGCWCHPKPCHCEVIRRAWEWLRSRSPTSPRLPAIETAGRPETSTTLSG